MKLRPREFAKSSGQPPVKASTASFTLATATFSSVSISRCGMLGSSSAATTASTMAGPFVANACSIAPFSSSGFFAVKPRPPQARAR